MLRQRASRGFTAVEVLVVLVVVGVLSCVLVPVIQLTRASARKAQCSENLRNLVLAAHAYSDVYFGDLPGIVPSSATATAKQPDSPSAGWSWHASLLPFLPKKEGLYEVYQALDWSDPHALETGTSTAAHRSALQRRIDAFLCPGDRGGRLSYVVNAGSWYDYDYAVTGRGRHDGFASHHRQSVTHQGKSGVPVLGPNIDAIPDGTGGSVMFAEVVHSPRVSGYDTHPAQRLIATGTELRMLFPDQARQICLKGVGGENADVIGQEDSGFGIFRHKKRFARGIEVGKYWHLSSPNRAGTVRGLLPPNSTNCLSQYEGGTGVNQRKDGAFGVRSASSWHAGGVNLALADGSVRFVGDDVDPQTYTALFSIDRGELTVTDERRTQEDERH